MSSKIETATQWMESHARNNSHGYDQIHRWGERGDYDCSAAVISAWQAAGVPVKSKGATYTGNMLAVFKKCGFTDVTSRVNRSTGAGLVRGDVLLNTSHHTAMYCGNGKEVEASINEKGKSTGGRPGDQTGKEFLIRSYRNYPWTNILRYTRDNSSTIASSATSSAVLRRGSSGSAVKTMQTMLIACGYSCGSSGADGSFGNGTYNALIKFQKANGLVADGIYGSQSKVKLESVYKAKTTKKTSTSTTTNTTSKKTASRAAEKFNRSLAGTYKTTSSLYMRHGPGQNYASIVIMPQRTKFTCYGYYSFASDGTKWYYGTATIGSTQYTGFASSKYLKK